MTRNPVRIVTTLVARLVCRHQGHVNAAWMLPEAEFGLYAYSRLFCSRCDLTLDWRPGFRELHPEVRQ